MVTDGRITRVGRHAGAAAARQRRRLRRQDRLAAPLQGRRLRGQGRLRVRHRLRASSTTSRSATSSRRSSSSGSRRRSNDELKSTAASRLCDVAPDLCSRLPPRPRRRSAPRGDRDLLAREVHDPGIGFLTITHVKVTPDLQVARVYYTTLGDEKARRDTAARARARDAVPAAPDRQPAAAEARARAGVLLRRDRSSAATASSEILQEISADAPHAERRRAGTAPTANRAGPRRASDDARRHDRDRRLTRVLPPDPRRDARPAAFPAHLARAPRRRLDRLAAGDGLRARRARQAGRASSTPIARPSTTYEFPGMDRIEIAAAVPADADADAVIVMECSDLSRTGVARPRGPLHHQHRSPRRQPDVRRGELVRRVGRGVRRDGLRRDPRARRAADARDRHAHLSGDPDRHRVVPPLEHHAAHLRHLPAGGRGGRQPGGDGAARLRQQQLRQAEADRRAARRDGAARRRAARGALSRRRDAGGVRLHAQRHRRADQPAADRARDPGGRVLQGRGRRRACASACGRSTTSTCGWSPTRSAAAATRTPPASPSNGPLARRRRPAIRASASSRAIGARARRRRRRQP